MSSFASKGEVSSDTRQELACSRLYLLIVEHDASARIDWDEFEKLVLDAAHRLECHVWRVEARHQFGRLLEEFDCHLKTGAA